MKRVTTPTIDHQAIIRVALQKIVGKSEWDNLTQITRGMSGASIYQVEVDKKTYVARFGSQNHWDSVLPNEIANMIKASDAGVSPKVYLTDPKVGLVLMQYINWQPAKQLGAGDTQHVQSLANLVSQLHQCPDFSAGPSFFQISQKLFQQLSLQYKNHSLVSGAGELLESLAKILSDPNDLRPSHRDMNPYNLLFNGKDYYLVDWEAASQDNLYYDLATCINYYFYDNNAAGRQFCEQYFGNSLGESQQYKLHLMRIAALIYAGTGFLFMGSKSGQPMLSSEACHNLPSYAEYMALIGSEKNLSDPLVQQEYGFVSFKEMKKLMEHPDYAASIEVVGRAKLEIKK